MLDYNYDKETDGLQQTEVTYPIYRVIIFFSIENH